MDKPRVLLVVGTRPEAIKMAPLIRACRDSDRVQPFVCFTGQHREMLRQVADYFEIEPDVDLQLMRPDQTLAGLTARCLESLDDEIQKVAPDCVVAQGDTTTVLASSMAAFYRKLPFVHIEAGLRTDDIWSPWPEEFNRRVASVTAALHCAPTEQAAENLRREGVDAETVRVTGNTVIDALLYTVERERQRADQWRSKYAMLADRRLVLITGHRRENFGEGFAAVCRGIGELAKRFPDVAFLYPVHLNPNVQGPVHATLGDCSNVHLTPPAAYPEFVWLMDRSTLILTDSGGVQEEAPSLSKPVLVMRDTTERPEAVQAGAAELVGANEQAIVEGVSRLLLDRDEYERRIIERNPYGDGNASQRIVELIASSFRTNQLRAA